MSWEIGIVITAVTCFFLGFYMQKISHPGKRIGFLLLAPYIFSYLLYWISATIEGRSAEHGAWAAIFISPWAVTGIVSMLIGFLVFTKYRNKKGR